MVDRSSARGSLAAPSSEHSRAIGYKLKKLDSDVALDYGVKINTAKESMVTLGRDDCLVVVAEDEC